MGLIAKRGGERHRRQRLAVLEVFSLEGMGENVKILPIRAVKSPTAGPSTAVRIRFYSRKSRRGPIDVVCISILRPTIHRCEVWPTVVPNILSAPRREGCGHRACRARGLDVTGRCYCRSTRKMQAIGNTRHILSGTATHTGPRSRELAPVDAPRSSELVLGDGVRYSCRCPSQTELKPGT